LDDGRLFFIGSRLYAHSTADGTPLWDADFGAFSQAALGNLTQTFPSVAYGKVVVVGARGVAAFDAGTGAPVWQSGQSEPGSCVAIADGRVVTSGGILLDVDTGAVLWQPATTISTWSPIVTDGHFYAGSLNGHIYGWGGAVPGEPPSY
jgi:outer membrane protein assembly factor BamB